MNKFFVFNSFYLLFFVSKQKNLLKNNFYFVFVLMLTEFNEQNLQQSYTLIQSPLKYLIYFHQNTILF